MLVVKYWHCSYYFEDWRSESIWGEWNCRDWTL